MIPDTLYNVGHHLKRFHAEEGGNATIEFVLFVPIVFTFFVSTFEMGMMSARQVMLDRGTDITVRYIRTGQMVDANGVAVVTRENIRDTICRFAASRVGSDGSFKGLIPECDDNLRVEMLRIDPHDWATGAGAAVAGAECRDRDDLNATPAGNLTVGTGNELIILRVCALVEPMAAAAGIGRWLNRRSGEYYALFSITAFVVEPT